MVSQTSDWTRSAARDAALRSIPPNFLETALAEIAATTDLDNWIAWLRANERPLRTLSVYAPADMARIEAANRERFLRFDFSQEPAHA